MRTRERKRGEKWRSRPFQSGLRLWDGRCPRALPTRPHQHPVPPAVTTRMSPDSASTSEALSRLPEALDGFTGEARSNPKHQK